MRYLASSLLLICAVSLHAQANMPDFVTKGLTTYQKTGGKEAMAVWLKGSALETDTTTQMNLTGGLAQLEVVYGKMVGFEPVRTVSVAPSVLRVYVVAKFERGPVFFAFECYRAEKDWIATFIDFNTKSSSILPKDILEGGR
jgi:hypothetical protein